jgi:hypothetical protein
MLSVEKVVISWAGVLDREENLRVSWKVAQKLLGEWFFLGGPAGERVLGGYGGKIGWNKEEV